MWKRHHEEDPDACRLNERQVEWCLGGGSNRLSPTHGHGSQLKKSGETQEHVVQHRKRQRDQQGSSESLHFAA